MTSLEVVEAAELCKLWLGFFRTILFSVGLVTRGLLNLNLAFFNSLMVSSVVGEANSRSRPWGWLLGFFNLRNTEKISIVASTLFTLFLHFFLTHYDSNSCLLSRSFPANWRTNRLELQQRCSCSVEKRGSAAARCCVVSSAQWEKCCLKRTLELKTPLRLINHSDAANWSWLHFHKFSNSFETLWFFEVN